MSKEIKKAEQQQNEAEQNALELDDDDLDQAVGGIGQSDQKNSGIKQRIDMPSMKLK